MSSYPEAAKSRYGDCAEWETVNCRLCPHLCSVAPSRSGNCGVRTNRGGVLYCDNYGRVAGRFLAASDALPLYHYAPGGKWLLLAQRGCTMRCTFCNTAKFSQLGGTQTSPLTPGEAVLSAKENGALGVAFGVNEPAPAHEFVFDVFEQAKEQSLKTHLATSGMWCREPFRDMLEVTSAVTFGFKGFDAEFLSRTAGGNLRTAMRNLEVSLTAEKHVEATYLVIEEHDRWMEELLQFGTWLAEVSQGRVPVLLLGLRKRFQWQGEETSREALATAHGLLSEHVPVVYVDDPDLGLMDTRCLKCHRPLVRRGTAGTILTELQDGKACPGCGEPVPYQIVDSQHPIKPA
ncbi:MAG: radical SAM protein [Sumerlaeia bacterium]